MLLMPKHWDLRLSFRHHFVDQARLHIPLVASIIATHPGSLAIESQDADTLKAHIGNVLGGDALPGRSSRSGSWDEQYNFRCPPRSSRAKRVRVSEQTTKMTETLLRATREGSCLLENRSTVKLGWHDDVERYKPVGASPDTRGSQTERDTYRMVISHRLRQVALSQGFVALQNGADLCTLDEDCQAYAKLAKLLASVMETLSETRGDLAGWVCAAMIGNGQGHPDIPVS